MKYSELISIKENFKSSINIEYDLLNFDKLSEYIPTEDACDIFKYYFNSFTSTENNRSTVLEGPYGKGKSYLLLSILQLISNSKDDKNYFSFMDKMAIVDKSLHSQIRYLHEKEFKLLPVIINSNYTHLAQSLNVALNEALCRVGLESLLPDSAFSLAVKILNTWKENPPVSKKELEKCLKKSGKTINELERNLKNYSLDSYKVFVDLYNCVIPGLEFNPLTNDDVVKNYENIAYKLDNYGYDGLFIVFDEFSKFIESDTSTLSNELKILQDLSEKCSRSGLKGQMHLCCVTHKSLDSYAKGRNEVVSNSFRTVEGRFFELRFNRSLNQNYRIISLALNKQKGFKNWFNEFEKNNREFYLRMKEYELFKELDFNLLKEGCFPLNPLTTYAAIQLAEIVAQNERTLFTFLADSDGNSLNTFIKKAESGLFNVDKIYDYYQDLFEKTDDEEIKQISYKAKASIEKAKNNFQKKILKVIAVMKIIRNKDLFIPTLQIISDSLNEDMVVVKKELTNLYSEKILKISNLTLAYDFAQLSNKEIDNRLDILVSKFSKNTAVSSALNELYNSEYVIPRRFNALYKMTRFYKELYLSETELSQIQSFEFLYKENLCDGIIINVLNEKKDINIKEHYLNMKFNECVVLKTVEVPLSEQFKNEVYRLKAMKELMKASDLDQLSIDEISLMFEDEKAELYEILNNIYDDNKVHFISKYRSNSYRELISLIFREEYKLTPIINNEMINKESNISTQYLKSRNTVINLYLDNKIDFIFDCSATSPERTVYNSVNTKDQNTIKVVEHIKNKLLRSENNRTCFAELINELKSKPYGIRSEVLPLIISKAIFEIDGEIIINYEKKEIETNADNLTKVVLNPEKYSFEIEKGSNEKRDYLVYLLKIFNLNSTLNNKEDVSVAVNAIRKWVMGLPQIIRSVSKKDNFLNMEKEFIEIKNMFSSFNINKYEVIFKNIPGLFNNNYALTIKKIKAYKNGIDSLLESYKNEIASELKFVFSKNSDSSLYNCTKDWLCNSKAEDKILNNDEKELIKFIKVNIDERNYSNSYFIDGLSKAVLHFSVTDWNGNHKNELIEKTSELIKTIDNRNFAEDVKDEENVELSVFGNMLKNSIIDSFDEYSESISNEEKIIILKQLINELL